MTDYLAVVGADPGPIPGMVILWFVDGQLKSAAPRQCDHTEAPDLLETWIRDTPSNARLVVQTEKFVVSQRAGRSSSAAAGQITRDLIGELKRVTAGQCTFVQHSAAMVKPWATDARLEAAGLLACTKGLRHARDGARHALYAACKYGRIPDPLSKKWIAT